MESTVSALILILIIMLVCVFSYWLNRFGAKRKAKTLEQYFQRVEQHVSVWADMYKTGPWYLVVYTKTSHYPIWIAHQNIRSVHADPMEGRLMVKLFNGEDMVIDDVENYEMQAANEMADFDFS